jgi:hypothetical protein
VLTRQRFLLVNAAHPEVWHGLAHSYDGRVRAVPIEDMMSICNPYWGFNMSVGDFLFREEHG